MRSVSRLFYRSPSSVRLPWIRLPWIRLPFHYIHPEEDNEEQNVNALLNTETVVSYPTERQQTQTLPYVLQGKLLLT